MAGYVVKVIKVEGKNKTQEDEVWDNAASYDIDENNNLSLYDDNQGFLYMYHCYNWAGIGKWPSDRE